MLGYIGKSGIILLIMMVLTSCASVTPPPAPSTQIPWKDRESRLDKIDHWQISGKIAVQTPKDAGSASVDWTQNQDRFLISLMGPLGSNALKLAGQAGKVTLETSDGKHYSASSPEQLLAERWGFHLPVSHLTYWIRGLPAPSIPANKRFDAAGRLSQITQQGWQVRFLSYTRAGKVDVPSKLAIHSPDLNVKIIVYNWKVM
jgi:outer membrane lipoprotein LolB